MSIVHTVSPGVSFVLEPGDLCVIREIFHEKVYHFEPRAGMRVLDIGAHKGIFSVYCALAGAQVWAYEPNPPSYAALLENIKRNNVEGLVYPHNSGVWTHADTLFLNQNQANSGGSSLFNVQWKEGAMYVPNNDAALGQRSDGVMVPVLPFNEVFGQEPWDIVKVDAEGIEFEVLARATHQQLRRIKFLTVEVHNCIGNDAQYSNMIRHLGVVFNITGVAEVSGKLNYIYATRR